MVTSDDHKSVKDIQDLTIDDEASPDDLLSFELTGANLVLVIVGLAIAIFLASIDTSIIGTAIPRITSQFNSTDDIGWYGTAYSFAVCAFQPIVGKLYADFSMKVSN